MDMFQIYKIPLLQHLIGQNAIYAQKTRSWNCSTLFLRISKPVTDFHRCFVLDVVVFFFLLYIFLIPFKNEMKKKTLPVRKAHQSWFEIRTVFCAAYIEVHEKSSKCYGSMLYKNKLWAEDCFKKQAGWSHGFYSAVELWHTAGTDARGWLLLPAWTPCFWGRSI